MNRRIVRLPEPARRWAVVEGPNDSFVIVGGPFFQKRRAEAFLQCWPDQPLPTISKGVING